MTGEMRIQATEHGFGIDMDFEDVCIVDEFELLHSVATGLGMTRHEIMQYCNLERLGVFDDAATVTHCKDDKHLERMLRGEGPGHQAECKSEQSEPDQLVQTLQKMASDLSAMLGKMEANK